MKAHFESSSSLTDNRVQRLIPDTYPFCQHCNLHVGTAAQRLCGVCKPGRKRKPPKVSFAELMRFGRLVRRHWGDGKARSLLFPTPNGTPVGYRPALRVRFDLRVTRDWTPSEKASERAACAELADLYDRLQHARGDSRRAVRV